MIPESSNQPDRSTAQAQFESLWSCKGRLEYRRTATSDSRTLVFLHEGLGSARLWRTFPYQLAQACGGLPTLAYSRHGYGWSEPVSRARSLNYMHEEALRVLPDVLQQLGIERPVLIGHSDGASIALIYASAGHPVEAVVAIAPHVFVESCTVEAIAYLARNYSGSKLQQRLRRHHAEGDATFWSWADVWLSADALSWDIRPALGNISVPTLVIQGREDPYGTVAQVQAVRTALRDRLEAVVLDSVGHFPHEEAAGSVIQSVRRFLTEPHRASHIPKMSSIDRIDG